MSTERAAPTADDAGNRKPEGGKRKGAAGDKKGTARDRKGAAGDQKGAEKERLKDFSAGGVVMRGDEVAVIVPKRRGHQDNRVLGLPKGHPDGDETEVEAAVREVREETGLVAEPVAKLGEIRYSYERKGQTIDKRVVFYLLEYRSGELAHDHEIEHVQWMPAQEALQALSYSGEREMLTRALSRRASDL